MTEGHYCLMRKAPVSRRTFIRVCLVTLLTEVEIFLLTHGRAAHGQAWNAKLSIFRAAVHWIPYKEDISILGIYNFW